MNYYRIILEGIDKTGKDQIREYIRKLSNGKYTCSARGFVSLMAYSNLYNRDYKYDIQQETNTIIVYLTVDKEDWEVRCKINNEPAIDYEKNKEAFEEVINKLRKDKFRILEYDTSIWPPYQIAKQVIEIVDSINEL